jgi:hypothetical protein
MAKTTKERQKDSVARHKSDPDYKEKQAERKRKWRANRQLIKSQIDKDKRSASDRQRKRRLKIRLENALRSNSDGGSVEPYKTAASLGKAINRVSRVLPYSPRKRSAVVRKLAVANSIFGSKSKKAANPSSIPQDTVDRVIDSTNEMTSPDKHPA